MMSFSKKFGIDKLDKKIIQLLEKNPDITHNDIADQIDRSQPAVGARIQKMEEKGILTSQYGLNFKGLRDLHIINLQVSTSAPRRIMEISRCCPYVLNCFQMSGEMNLMVMIIADNLNKADIVINNLIRGKKCVQKTKMEIITNIQKDFVLPVNMIINSPKPDCSNSCDECMDCYSKRT